MASHASHAASPPRYSQEAAVARTAVKLAAKMCTVSADIVLVTERRVSTCSRAMLAGLSVNNISST